MFRWYNNLKMRSKLILAFLVMVGLTALVSGVSVISNNSMEATVDRLLDVDVRKAQLALETHYALLMAQRAEKDYLLHYKELGFEEAQSEYVTQVQSYVADVREHAAELVDLEIHQDDIARAEEMDAAIVEYETTFLAVVDLIEKRGHVDSGLEGQFRDKVHAIEDAVAEEYEHEAEGGHADVADLLTIDMLTIRRNEKDYLLRGESKYVTQVRDAVAQFKADVAASEIPQAEQQYLIGLADEYQALFDQLVQADEQVAAGMQAYRDAVLTLEPMIHKVHTHAEEDAAVSRGGMARTNQAARTLLIAVGVVSAIAGVGLGLLIAFNIANPIQKIAGLARMIARGDLGQKVDIVQRDEIGQLADAFRDMGDSLRAKAEAAVEIARGNLSVAVPVASDVDTLGNAMVTMKESIGAMAADVNGLIEAAVAGKLDARADPSRFEGQYRRIVQGVNDTLDAVIGPLNVAAEYVDRISKGDIPEPIADEYRGDFNEIKNNLNLCIDAVNGLVAEVDTLTRAAVAGQLDARGDPARFHGSYARLVQGINNTLDAVIGPLNVAGEYVDRISKGDIPEPIADEYRGDFNEIKNNLNMCIAAINGLVGEVNTLTRSAVEGRLEVRGDAALFSGGYARIVGGINATIETLVGHLDTVPAPVVIMDDQFSMRYVNKAGADLLEMTQEHLIGKKCYDCFKTSDCRTANCACARAMDSGLRETSETVARPNGQDLSIVYTGQPIKDREGTIIGALEVVVDQTEIRRMMDRLQETNEGLQTTVSEYSTFAEGVGRGDLTTKLSLNGHGQEDDPLVVLGHNLNGMVDNLRAMASQTAGATQALSTAATQILAATTEQATGASEQSAAISQATTTVDEIKTIAEQLVSRSQSVADIARRTVEVSRAGQGLVQETVTGMSQIKARVDVIEENILALSERTNQIGEIIDTVNTIASQSNMLALNASVEAARAGEQGKGFAVVAEEVRDLAERSTQATAQVKAILSDIQKATNATGMATEEGKKGVDSGVQLVGQMGEAIDQLAQVINESAQSAMQMSAGGQQQQSGMEQIAVAMQNINQVTVQSMTATRQAEKSAQQLNELAGNLAEIVEQFQL